MFKELVNIVNITVMNTFYVSTESFTFGFESSPGLFTGWFWSHFEIKL